MAVSVPTKPTSFQSIELNQGKALGYHVDGTLLGLTDQNPVIFPFMYRQQQPHRYSDGIPGSLGFTPLLTIEKGRFNLMRWTYVMRDYSTYALAGYDFGLRSALFEGYHTFDEAGFSGGGSDPNNYDNSAFTAMVAEASTANSSLDSGFITTGKYDIEGFLGNTSPNSIIPQINGDGDFDIVLTSISNKCTIKGVITFI